MNVDSCCTVWMKPHPTCCVEEEALDAEKAPGASVRRSRNKIFELTSLPSSRDDRLLAVNDEDEDTEDRTFVTPDSPPVAPPLLAAPPLSSKGHDVSNQRLGEACSRYLQKRSPKYYTF